MSIVKVESINKSFGKKKILHDVSFEINEGEILGFIGPNGAGKTTTIKLMLGLQSIDSGEVYINGYNLRKDFEKAIEKVGAIIESPDVYMYLSGRENLKLIANLYGGISKEELDELIKTVGLEKRIDDKVSKYSLGMRQRLGIAASIINKPNVLFLDEPTNGLDPEGIKQLRDLLTKLAKEENMGILISSHNLAELESFCNKISIIQNGKIIETSSLEDAKRVKGRIIYEIELDSTDGVDKIVENEINIIDSHIIKINITKEEIPEIVSKLVNENKKIYKVCEDTISLEDAFLKKTGGNVID